MYFSNSYLLNGNWNITNLQYETQIDLPIVGTQTISGEAYDAGSWSFQYPEYTCSNSLSFVTEGLNILGQTLPGIPIDVSSDGTWELSNNDNNLLITDQTTNLISGLSNIICTRKHLFFKWKYSFCNRYHGIYN